MIGSHFPGYEVVPDDAKAGLLIVHGIAEHSARYRHVAAALAAEGIACFVYDQRGHGEHPGVRTHIADFADFARDMKKVGAALRQKFPSLPLFVWGHSMGSIVVTLAALDGLAWARGIITTGAALNALPRLDGVSGIGLRIAAGIAPRLRIGLGIDGSTLTHVVEIQKAHMSDPLVPRTASLKLLYGFALACRECNTHLAKITHPWLAVHGEADTVCPPSGSQALIAGIGSKDKQLVTYPKLRHEVHNEDELSRAALFSLMSQWIVARSV
jgi:alpha-beta hydrolase superfamily lysophospholipase